MNKIVFICSSLQRKIHQVLTINTISFTYPMLLLFVSKWTLKKGRRNQNFPLSISGKMGSVCSPPEDPLLTEALDRFLSLSHKSDPLWQFPSLSTLRVGIISNIKTNTSKNSFLERGLDNRSLQELPRLGFVSPECKERSQTKLSLQGKE